MKKIKFYVLLLLLVVFIPINIRDVKADTFEPIFTGDENASVGDKIEFTIAIKTDMEVNSFETTLKYDSKIIELNKVNAEEKWSLEKTSENNKLKFNTESITGESTVVTLEFIVKNNSNKGNTTLKFDEIKLYSVGDTPTIKTSDAVTKTIKLKSDDNTLKNIKLNGKAISGFTATTYNYTVEVASGVEEVEIEGVLNEENSNFIEDFGNRKETLEYGSNTFMIKIKSESGKDVTYTINVIRKDDRVVNNDLKSIIINSGKVKLNFDPSVLSYTVKTYKLEDYTIEVEASDKEAKVEIKKPEKLAFGDNNIIITVTAVTGDKKDYTVNIFNNENPTDTRLKNLSVKGASIDFDSDVSKYEIIFTNSLKKNFTLYKTTISKDVEVIVTGDNNIKPGSVIKVTVTAIDGSGESIYTIKLKKDTRVNFFAILEITIFIILLVVFIILLIKRKKTKEQITEQEKELELEKTKEINF